VGGKAVEHMVQKRERSSLDNLIRERSKKKGSSFTPALD